MKQFLTIILLTITTMSFADPVKRQLTAVRTKEKITIDGNLDDNAWKSAALATDFVQWRPSFGKVEENPTEIRILYDDAAIYIAGYCHEKSRDSITTELVGRDMVGSNDFVGVLFDTYNDKINGFGYYVTPLGEQYDAKYSSQGEDGSWNSVYYTAAKIVNDGWTFEMKIPYSAIRFSSKDNQSWGMNITRRRKKSGQQFMWNPTDPTINGLFNQAGQLTNITQIKPPVRLSFSPYLSTYANHDPLSASTNSWSSAVNGGMDVKYGINQSMTLDLTLIPDFGQVQSDNRVLNLTPYEVKYNEYRTFFTEGTDLFSKGNLFYSRRIGGEPLHSAGEFTSGKDSVLKEPVSTKLINAAKISGRTSSGFGIGVLNAVTATTYATIADSAKAERRVEISPLTNYNILVLDQALKHNSSVSLVNTNVLRSGSDYDANVTAALWDIYDKNVNYNFWGKVGYSQLVGYLPGKKNLNGYTHNVSFGKMKGNFNWSINEELADDKYQQNDLGYLTNNNFFNHYTWIGYKLLKPKAFYQNLYFNLNAGYNQRFTPRTFQNFWANTNVNGTLKNLWQGGVSFNYNGSENDFYEARQQGLVFKRPYNFNTGIWLNSNYAKKYAASINLYYTYSPEYNGKTVSIYYSEQYRFNDHLTLKNELNVDRQSNAVGYATKYNGNSIFGLRDRKTIENIFNIKYNFSNKMGLTFRARHYWSNVKYNQYMELKDGLSKLQDNVASQPGFKNPNYNVNFFNIDMVYTWQFAQGSFINIVWKDAASTLDNNVDPGYFKNFSNSVAEPQFNSLSLRIIYYLDYLSLKKGR